MSAQNIIDVCEPSVMHQTESTRASDAVVRMRVGWVGRGARTCRTSVAENGAASLVAQPPPSHVALNELGRWDRRLIGDDPPLVRRVVRLGRCSEAAGV